MHCTPCPSTRPTRILWLLCEKTLLVCGALGTVLELSSLECLPSTGWSNWYSWAHKLAKPMMLPLNTLPRLNLALLVSCNVMKRGLVQNEYAEATEATESKHGLSIGNLYRRRYGSLLVSLWYGMVWDDAPAWCMIWYDSTQHKSRSTVDAHVTFTPPQIPPRVLFVVVSPTSRDRPKFG